MKIVSKAELMEMPRGTAFAEYRPEGSWPEGFDVFLGPCGYIDDFYYVATNNPSHSNSEQLWERERQMGKEPVSYPVDLMCSREGLYDNSIRYLVWEPEDVERIIALLRGGSPE